MANTSETQMAISEMPMAAQDQRLLGSDGHGLQTAGNMSGALNQRPNPHSKLQDFMKFSLECCKRRQVHSVRPSTRVDDGRCKMRTCEHSAFVRKYLAVRGHSNCTLRFVLFFAAGNQRADDIGRPQDESLASFSTPSTSS